MNTLEQCLNKLYADGLINQEEALEKPLIKKQLSYKYMEYVQRLSLRDKYKENSSFSSFWHYLW